MLILFLNIRNWLNTEEGQDLAEYGLLLGFIAVVLMIAVVVLGEGLLAYFDVLGAEIEDWLELL